MFIDTNTAFNVFTAVLIRLSLCFSTNNHLLGNVACFGKQQFYLKNALVIEQLAVVNTIVLIKREP
jgi:Cu+-exporting ATPase